jgi:RNA-binding protein
MLTKDQIKALRAQAHERKVIVRVGQNGLTDTVLEELEAALDHHELVKIGVRAGGRLERDRVIEALRTATGADIVQKIGNTVVFYRRNTDKPVITLPGSGKA